MASKLLKVELNLDENPEACALRDGGVQFYGSSHFDDDPMGEGQSKPGSRGAFGGGVREKKAVLNFWGDAWAGVVNQDLEMFVVVHRHRRYF